MNKQKRNIFLTAAALFALVLSACNAPATASPTEVLGSINTAVAETLTAQAALSTATPEMTATPLPSNTPAVTATMPPTIAPASSPTSAAAANFCDNSMYVSDVTYPDNTVVAPGLAFEKTWAVKNTGTCAWTESYSVTYISGDQMNGSSEYVGQAVASQAQVNVSVSLAAPLKPGTYSGYWRLANSKGAQFGQVLSVVIIVSSGTVTVTVTPTATAATATPTPTVAATATASSTPVPSATVTPTP